MLFQLDSHGRKTSLPSSEWSERLGQHCWLRVTALHPVSLPSFQVDIRPHWEDACLASHSRMPMGIWILKEGRNLVPAPNLQGLKSADPKVAKSLSDFTETICDRHQEELLDSKDYENTEDAAKEDRGTLSWREDYSPTLMVQVQFWWEVSLKQTILWGHSYSQDHKHLLYHFFQCSLWKSSDIQKNRRTIIHRPIM